MRNQNLIEIASLFLKLGTFGFGGPAAHIALMEEEVVQKRRWYTKEEFLDLIAVCNLIPGPNSTEMAIHIGYRMGGFLGLLIAGSCFILPAFFIVLFLAWAYTKYGILPEFSALIYGIKPVIIAIIFQALFRLGKSAISSLRFFCLLLLCIFLRITGFNELFILLFGALSVPLFKSVITNSGNKKISITYFALPLNNNYIKPLALTSALGLASLPPSLLKLFLVFLKTGSVIFGSGYVLIAFLKSDFVDKLAWLSNSQLIDAIVVGQITPGPVFTTATFIGYIILGYWGAIVATLGIFIPAFFFVAITAPFINSLRNSQFMASMLDGLNVASLALMACVTYTLSLSTLSDSFTWIEFFLALIALYIFKLSSTLLILIGGLIGCLAYLLF